MDRDAFADAFADLLKSQLLTKTHYPAVAEQKFDNAHIVVKTLERFAAEPSARISELFLESDGKNLKDELDHKCITSLFIYFFFTRFDSTIPKLRAVFASKTVDECLQLYGSVDTTPILGTPSAFQEFMMACIESKAIDENLGNHVHAIVHDSTSFNKTLKNLMQFFQELYNLSGSSDSAPPVPSEEAEEAEEVVDPPPPEVSFIKVEIESAPVPARGSFWTPKAAFAKSTSTKRVSFSPSIDEEPPIKLSSRGGPTSNMFGAPPMSFLERISMLKSAPSAPSAPTSSASARLFAAARARSVS
jgi:hypothetical protein